MPVDFNRKLFSSRRLLFDYYLRGKLPDVQDISFETYIGIRSEHYCLPDHALKNARNAVFKDNSDSFVILFKKAILHLAQDNLELIGGAPYVKLGRLESWNSLLTVISPVPIISMLLAENDQTHQLLSDKRSVQRVFDIFYRSTLPSPRDVQLEKLMQREGGCDLHIHLNGTSEAAYFWQHALNSPKKFGMAIRDSLSDETLKEFYAEHGFPKSVQVERLIELASWIQERLSSFLFTDLRNEGSMERECVNLPSRGELLSALTNEEIRAGGRKRHSLASIIPGYSVHSDVALEALMLVKAFNELSGGCSLMLSYLLHIYLLIQSVVTRLVIQQVSQNGFDQFQKITNNQLRDVYEDKQTHERFRQLFGMYGEGVSYIEGRFSPKKTAQKNVELLNRVLKGYQSACEERERVNRCHQCLINNELPIAKTNHPDLRLVAHFIKRADTSVEDSCWHYALRRHNAGVAKALLKTFEEKEELCRHITGVDAAANELHTSPEVYAPIYNYFRAYGFSSFTYHVGEDFRHLLSGLRAVDEALEFLSLGSGDRIGHGTALGINPDLWKKGIGSTVWMPQGEWLDNLVWLHLICRKSPQLQRYVGVLRSEIEELLCSVYDPQEPIVLSAYEKAWQNRALDPFAGILDGDSKAVLLESEKSLVTGFKNKNKLAFDLLKKYHSSDWRRAYKVKIPVKIDDDNFAKTDLLRDVQDYLVEKLNRKNCLVEVMPTSNLRISFYSKYEEHHLFEWVDDTSARPSPKICIATDDPGIFSTNLRNELGIILEVLRRKYANGNANKPYEIIEELLQNASSYCFKKSPLTPFFER